MRASPRPLLAAALALGVGLALACVGRTAAAAPLSADETARLERGEAVSRPQTVEDDAHRYVGGVTYALVDATERDLLAIFADVAAYRRILPRTTSAVRVGVEGGDDLVELRQGTSIFEASYTIRVHVDLAARTVRFWLDPSRPHGIADAWGFFRVEPTNVRGKVLLVCGALVDLGDGLARALFEERVQASMLGVPDRVRAYVTSERAARRYARSN